MGEATDESRGVQLALYAAAYRLVHLLRNAGDAGAPARFDAFVAAVEGGTRTESAFAVAFGDPASPALDARYRRYLTAELRPVDAPFTAARGVPRVAAHPMTSGEVLLLWSRLRPWKRANLDAVRRDLERAVVLEQGSAEARYRRGILALRQAHYDDALRDFDAAVSTAPREPRYLLARAIGGRLRASAGGGAEASLIATYGALAQAATTASQLNEVAWALAMLGRPVEGLPFADRAIAADPTCYNCEDTRAVLLFATGRVPEALAAADRAVALLPEERPSRTLLVRRRVLRTVASLAPAPGDGAPGLSPRVLAAVTQLYGDTLRSCPEHHGRGALPVRARIAPEGSVRAAWPSLPAADPGTMSCTLKVVKGMVFPPFAGAAVEVSLPLPSYP